MTRSEADRLIKNIERASGEELDSAIDNARKVDSDVEGVGLALGGGAGALLGSLAGESPWMKVLGGILGGLIGGGAGYGLGSLSGKNERSRLYGEAKKRKEERINQLLSQLDEKSMERVKGDVEKAHSGIQTKDTPYGAFVRGKGNYSGDDRLILKKDEDGRPVLSLLFAGINSSVEDGGKSTAKSPLAERFYNKNRGKFSDVQANTVFDEPIVADAYIDKIVAKIMENRRRTGVYPRIRVVGYSAGGRGVVNFLKKMRERDPNFRADEIIGIDAYQRPWEGIPSELSDRSNPIAERIVYSRPADKYTGSSQSGLSRIGDVLSNTAVALMGKQLNGLSANTVVENRLPGVAHTDADAMYDSALHVLSDLRSKRKNKETT